MPKRSSRPFAEVKQQSKGWYAVSRVGMSSGPWGTEAEAKKVADLWNEAAGH